MDCKTLAALISLLSLTACVPRESILTSRNIESLDIGANNTIYSLSNEDQEVDIIASEVVETLSRVDFHLSHQSTPYGLLPPTGHTVNVSFVLAEDQNIHCTVLVSKHQFSASFYETEVEPKSNTFNTSESDIAAIKRASEELEKLLLRKYPGHELRISSYLH